MRVTYVTSGLPYPLTSGKLRHYFLTRGLAERHEVTLLTLTASPPDPADVREVESVVSVRLEPEAASRTGLRRILGLGDETSRRVGAHLLEAHESGSLDAVVLSGRRAYSLFRGLRGKVPILFDLCDARSLHLGQSLRHAPLRKRPLIAARLAHARWRELVIVGDADMVMFSSPRDGRAVLGFWPAEDKAVIVPNGVDLEYWQRRRSQLGSDLIFTGAMDYPPNTDAALQLIEVVMPLVRRDLPDARLQIVGRDPPLALRQRAEAAGVSVTGFVDDMRPYLEQAAVFAAPLRFGAGIQNKLLEAMAMEVPSVVSSLASAGLETQDGKHPPISVEDQPAAMAAAVVRLMKEVDSNPRPARELRDYVDKHFSWPAAVDTLESGLMRIASPDARRAIDPVA